MADIDYRKRAHDGDKAVIAGVNVVARSLAEFDWGAHPCMSCHFRAESSKFSAGRPSNECPYRSTCNGIVWMTPENYVVSRLEK